MPDNQIQPPPDSPDASPAFCGRCGAPEASRFGDEIICDDCYVHCGACCADDPDNEG